MQKLQQQILATVNELLINHKIEANKGFNSNTIEDIKKLLWNWDIKLY